MIRNFEKSIGAQSDKLHLPTMANYDGIEKGGRHFGGAMIKHIYASVASFFFFLFLPKEHYWQSLIVEAWSTLYGYTCIRTYTDIYGFKISIYTDILHSSHLTNPNDSCYVPMSYRLFTWL